MKRCLCFNDYKALVIEGEPDEAAIQDKWLSIYSEFVTLSHEVDILLIKSLRASVIVLRSRLAKVHLCVATIRDLGHEWVVNENDDEAIDLYNFAVECLRKLNFRYKYDPFGSTFDDDLDMVLARSIEWELHLELKEAELAAIEAKNTGEPVPPTYFTKMLARISQHYKFMIDERQLSTAQYCIMKKDFVDDINRINAQRDARKR